MTFVVEDGYESSCAIRKYGMVNCLMRSVLSEPIGPRFEFPIPSTTLRMHQI